MRCVDLLQLEFLRWADVGRRFSVAASAAGGRGSFVDVRAPVGVVAERLVLTLAATARARRVSLATAAPVSGSTTRRSPRTSSGPSWMGIIVVCSGAGSALPPLV